MDQQPRTKYDVEIPPAALSHANQYLEEDKWLSPLKKLVDGKKTQDKMRWVNSPNVYQKVEVSEVGTPEPKKITKVRTIFRPTKHVHLIIVVTVICSGLMMDLRPMQVIQLGLKLPINLYL